MAAVVVLPSDKDLMYAVYPNGDTLKPLCDIVEARKDFSTLASSRNAMLIVSTYRKCNVTLFTERHFTQYGPDPARIARVIDSGVIPLIHVCPKTAAVFHTALGAGNHPISLLMSNFCDVLPERVDRLLCALVDPRVFMRTSTFTTRALSRMLRFAGITKTMMLTFIRTWGPEQDLRSQLAWMSLRGWVGKRAKDMKSIFPDNYSYFIYPSETSTSLLHRVDDYFWRCWSNLLITGAGGHVALQQTTKRFCELLFKLWADWLGLYNFSPELFFHYKCEQQWMQATIDKWRQSVVSEAC